MYQVGVDIGGTNIAMGLVDEALDVVQRESMPFEIKGGGERTAEIIHEGTLAMLKRQGAGLYDLDSVGVVVPGSIDPTGSVVINAYNLNFHNDWTPTFLWVFKKPLVWGPVGHHPKVPKEYILPVY